MDNREIILDVKKLNTSFVSDRKEVRIVKDVSFQLKRGTALAAVSYTHLDVYKRQFITPSPGKRMNLFRWIPRKSMSPCIPAA